MSPKLTKTGERGTDTHLTVSSSVSHSMVAAIQGSNFELVWQFSGTVHKSRGQILDNIVIDLRSPFFSSGQLYVALSRVRRSQDVLLLHMDYNTAQDSGKFYQMPVTVPNSILPEAVRFAEEN